MHNVAKVKMRGFSASIVTKEKSITKALKKHAERIPYKNRSRKNYKIYLKFSKCYNLKKCKIIKLNIIGGQDLYEVSCPHLFNAKIYIKTKKIYLEIAKVEHGLFFVILNNIFLSISLIRLFKNNCFLLHAACALYKKQAYIFCGHPSAGKTTISNMLKHKMKILTDELVVIRKENKIWTAKPAPFRVWDAKHSNRAYPIGAIFQLKKAKYFNVSPVSFKDTITFLMSDIPYLPASKEICAKVLTRAELLAKRIPSFLLEFTKKEIPIGRLLFAVKGVKTK